MLKRRIVLICFIVSMIVQEVFPLWALSPSSFFQQHASHTKDAAALYQQIVEYTITVKKIRHNWDRSTPLQNTLLEQQVFTAKQITALLEILHRKAEYLSTTYQHVRLQDMPTLKKCFQSIGILYMDLAAYDLILTLALLWSRKDTTLFPTPGHYLVQLHAQYQACIREKDCLTALMQDLARSETGVFSTLISLINARIKRIDFYQDAYSTLYTKPKNQSTKQWMYELKELLCYSLSEYMQFIINYYTLLPDEKIIYNNFTPDRIPNSVLSTDISNTTYLIQALKLLEKSGCKEHAFVLNQTQHFYDQCLMNLTAWTAIEQQILIVAQETHVLAELFSTSQDTETKTCFFENEYALCKTTLEEFHTTYPQHLQTARCIIKTLHTLLEEQPETPIDRLNLLNLTNPARWTASQPSTIRKKKLSTNTFERINQLEKTVSSITEELSHYYLLQQSV